jgi:hypothetical protein
VPGAIIRLQTRAPAGAAIPAFSLVVGLLRGCKYLAGELDIDLGESEIELGLVEREPGTVQRTRGDGGIRPVVEQKGALLSRAAPLARAVQLGLQARHGFLQIDGDLSFGVRGRMRAVTARSKLGQPVGLHALEPEALRHQRQAVARRLDPALEILFEGRGIGLRDRRAGIRIALAQAEQLLRGLAPSLGALEIGLGAGQNRAVGERVRDSGNPAVGADTLARIERMGTDIPGDRRSGMIDPAGDRGVAQHDRAQVRAADPADIHQERGQCDEAYRSPPIQPERHSPPLRRIIASPSASGKAG